jgi:exonuclease III
MRIVSWNCRNGFNGNKPAVFFKEFPNADIFIIQECKRGDIYSFDHDWKFKNWYGDDQEKSDLGIAILSKNYEIEFTNIFNRKFRYFVPYSIKINKKIITLFVVWTKPVEFYYDKNVTQAVLASEYKDLIGNGAIIIGDFNTGYSEEHPEYYSNLCKNLISFKNCALGKPEEYLLTYYSFTEKKMYLSDFCFVSESLYGNLTKFEIHNNWEEDSNKHSTWRGLSDHCPISVEFDF